MIWLHIGMPKSGSSSLQGYLANETDVLDKGNIRFVQTGRVGDRKVPLPSHNLLARQMHSGWKNIGPSLFDAYVDELRNFSGKSRVISAEMFYGQRLARLQEKIFSRIDEPVNVVIYLKRFSDFLDSDYKQKVKKGRDLVSAEHYARSAIKAAETRPEYMNYALMLKQIAADIPNAVIHPRLFLRDQLVGGDIITDFLNLLGVPLEAVKLPEKRSNVSLSRVSSEALGLFASKEGGVNEWAHRRIDIALQSSSSGDFFGKGDVFLPDEARHLDELLEDRNAGLLADYFPSRDRLFPKVEDYRGKYLRGDPSELSRFRDTVREILKIRGRAK
ncbi:hypothetical protein [Paracoccus sp. KR1-242]|uniref:hypothetical protein n=1 Tax=Paracoccus sp. KR1-242 TaxID=3410028 RepID=UPI003C0E6032